MNDARDSVIVFYNTYVSDETTTYIRRKRFEFIRSDFDQHRTDGKISNQDFNLLIAKIEQNVNNFLKAKILFALFLILFLGSWYPSPTSLCGDRSLLFCVRACSGWLRNDSFRFDGARKQAFV
eukprot:TRINITY_DN636_c0_g2_i7.p4 TRINITY_DN636_c0_g2~~TRINITY_DN636_c0_g2_i7.p4  ORF type:complete len:123 (-),score=10.78 TRINITY_DN636_c0_g2_i7:307-675(-)